jgi:hypothetical protein
LIMSDTPSSSVTTIVLSIIFVSEIVFMTSSSNNLHSSFVFSSDRCNLVLDLWNVLTGIITDVFNYNFNCFKMNPASAPSAALFCIFIFVSNTCMSNP